MKFMFSGDPDHSNPSNPKSISVTCRASGNSYDFVEGKSTEVEDIDIAFFESHSHFSEAKRGPKKKK
jgi:hypothetical protein